jgi:uncharacterized membrane protein
MTKALPRAPRLPVTIEPVRLREGHSSNAIAQYQPQIIDIESAPSAAQPTPSPRPATPSDAQPTPSPRPAAAGDAQPSGFDPEILGKALVSATVTVSAAVGAMALFAGVFVLLYAILSGGPPAYRDRGHSHAYSDFD